MGYITTMKQQTEEILMNDIILITIYNHDDETTETITLTQFIKRFNNEHIDSSSYSIKSINHPTK